MKRTVKTTLRRSGALLAAALLSALLALPVSAEPVNTQDDPIASEYYDGVYYDEEAWKTRPFHAYWTDKAYTASAIDGTGSIYALINAYFAGEGSSREAGYKPGLETVVAARVWTEQDWQLTLKSEKVGASTDDLVYSGLVRTGDRINVAGYNIRMMNGNAISKQNRDVWMAKNAPEYQSEWAFAPTDKFAFYTNIRVVHRDGRWLDGAEDFVWPEETGDAVISSWEYTVQEGDELIYADVYARSHLSNYWTGEEKAVIFTYRFELLVSDSGFILQTETSDAQEDPGEDEGTEIHSGIVEPEKPAKPSGGSESKAPDAGTIALTVGGAVAAGAVVGGAAAGGHREDKSTEDEKKKRYKMYVYKDFGDFIRKGAAPVYVYARISQIIDGKEYDCPEQTAKIAVSGENLSVRSAGKQGAYMAAEVSAAADTRETQGTVTFTLNGPGGTFRRNIVFRLTGEPRIAFPGDTPDGRWDLGVRNDTADLIGGRGGHTRLRFVFLDAAEEPRTVRFSASDGLRVAPEKDTRLQFTYYAVIDDRTAPIQKEGGIFAREDERPVTILAEFPDGTTVSDRFTVRLWPDGLYVTLPKDKNIRGQVKNGRLEVETVPTVMGGDWNGDETIPATPFELCVGATDDKGSAAVHRNVAARFSPLDDGGAYGNTFKGNFRYEIRRNSFGHDFCPGDTLPAMYDPYLAQTEVSCEVGGQQYAGVLPLSLIGEKPRKPSSAVWQQAYEKLKKDVLYFGVGADPQLRAMLRDAHLHSAGELEYTRYYLLLSAVLYYESCSREYEKIDAVLSRCVVVSGALVKAGDYACEYLLTRVWPKELGGGIAAKFLNPLKNMYFNWVGQFVGPGSELNGDYESLPFFQTLLQGTEEALEESITGDMKPSPENLGYVVATYLMVCFVKHYYGLSDDPGVKGDVYRSLIAAAKDLTFMKFKSWLSGVIQSGSALLVESLGKFCGTVFQGLCTDSMQRAMKLAGDTAFQDSVRQSIQNGGLSTAQYLAAKAGKVAAIQAEQAFQQKLINDGAKVVTKGATKVIGAAVEGADYVLGAALNYAVGGSRKDGSALGVTVPEVLIGYVQDRWGVKGAQVFQRAADAAYGAMPVRVEDGQLIFAVPGVGYEVCLPVMENVPALVDAAFAICFDWVKIIFEMSEKPMTPQDLRDRLEQNTAIVEQQRQIIENLPPIEFRKT